MEQRGKLAFVSLEIYPTTAGGVGILLHHTIRFLLSAGYEIVLLLDVQPHEFERFSQMDRMDFENGGNLHVYNVHELCDDVLLPTVAIPHGEVLRSAKIAAALDALCSRHDIDLVEFYDYCGPAYYFLGSALANPPMVVVRLHNTIEMISRKIRSAREPERLMQFSAERASLMGADLVLSSGRNFYDREVAPLYPEIASNRVQMSPPIHAPVGAISYSPLTNDVAFYGRLSTFKGLDRFIKGAVLALQSQEFSEWLGKFVIMGPEETVASTYSLEDMKGFIPPDLQHRFEFTGRVDHVTLMRRLENVAFACFANRMESFCYAAHELHTAGVPLIVSDTATFCDHFTERETAVFFDNTARGLSERMIELAQDRPLRLALSAAGRARLRYYRVDHYAAHLATARERRALRENVPADPMVMILSNGNHRALAKTLRVLEGFENAPKYLILRLDDAGGFKFAGQRWKVFNSGNEQVNHELTAAPEAAVLVRAGDQLSETWLKRAADLMARRSDVGAVAGWFRSGDQILMGSICLLPEGASRFEPGLRCLIRLNPRNTLQDAFMSRPDDCEVSMLLALRAQNRILLTVAEVCCDIEDAIGLPSPSFTRLLNYDLDRISLDYMADKLSRSEVILENEEGSSKAVLERSLHDQGFFSLRAVPQPEEEGGGGGELLLLRFFRDRGEQAAPWSVLQLDGDWSIRSDAGGPVSGALRTETGSATGYVRNEAAADVLVSPWASQVEVIFRGQKKTIDLKGEQVNALRVIFDADGIRARRVIARTSAAEKPVLLSLTEVPEQFAQSGACDTLILCKTRADMLHWPAEEELKHRSMVAQESVFLPDRADGTSALAILLEKTGARRLVLSSQLAPTPGLERALRALRKDLDLGFMLCGGPQLEDEGETLLCHLAQWYAVLEPYMDRLLCVGGPKGMLDLLRVGGASTLCVPSTRPLQARVLSNTIDTDAPVSVALMLSDQPPRNLMHMLNAVLMAAAKGMTIDRVYLPQSYQDRLAVLEHFHLDVKIEFFADSAGLAFVGEGTKRIAIGSYPQEYLPPQLAEAAALGWLPLAGAVTEFAEAPKSLETALSEPYWENSALLAAKLSQMEHNYEALMQAYSAFVKEQENAASAALTKFLTTGESDVAAGAV